MRKRINDAARLRGSEIASALRSITEGDFAVSPIVQVGTYTGTGATFNMTLNFSPDHLEIINVTDRDEMWFWNSGMSNHTAVRVQSQVESAAGGVTPLSNGGGRIIGFTVDTQLSENGKLYSYKAIKNRPTT